MYHTYYRTKVDDTMVESILSPKTEFKSLLIGAKFNVGHPWTSPRPVYYLMRGLSATAAGNIRGLKFP